MKISIILNEVLTEIGDATNPYPIQNKENILQKIKNDYANGNYDLTIRARFTTKDNLNYVISIDGEYAKTGYEFELGFGVMNGNNVDMSTRTDKKDTIRVISTVIDLCRDISQIIPIQEIWIKPSRKEGEENLPTLETSLGSLYKKYIERLMPNAKIVSTTSKSIRIIF